MRTTPLHWTAQMIAPETTLDSAPLLRGEFELATAHGAVVSADLVLTAQGAIETWLNGQPVSDELLTPGWSSFEWRLRYVVYDVRELLAQTNVLGITLGKGWYGGRLGWAPGKSWYGDQLGALAQLEVVFEDGHRQVFGTDETWAAGPSAILANDLYDGETIDARRRNDSWMLPNCSPAGWGPTQVLPFETSKLQRHAAPRLKQLMQLPVREITTSPSGRTLVDFGQNLVGWIKLRVRGVRGAQVTIRHAEILEDGELGTRPLRTAEATDRFILSGGDDEFEPTFTIHGFRFAEITGWPGELHPGDLSAVVVGSDMRRIGRFRTSNDLLNRFHENVVWSMRGNFVDVPTDCPQRDERLGWTGDLAVFAPTAAFLYDVNAFLENWLVDLAVEQEHHDGIVGWVIPDIYKYLPEDPKFGPVESTAIWSDAAVWVPWSLYQAYGNEEVLRRQFDSMSTHVRRVRSLLSPAGLWEGNFQFGDWLDPDSPPDQPENAKADPAVVATACAYRSADMVARAAQLLGFDAEHTEFARTAEGLRRAFNAEYVTDGVIRSDCTTVYTLAIVFGLLEPADRKVAGHRLVQLVRLADHRVSTGFAGTPFLADALSSTGHVEDAYRLLTNRECPSWLYPVTMGATTIWERWDSLLPDGAINPSGMTSFNHYAFGAVADWMHRTIGGIAALAPGYSKVLIAPHPGGGLEWAETSLTTPQGRVEVNWRMQSDMLTVETVLPVGSEGILRLPGHDDKAISSGRVLTSVFLPLGPSTISPAPPESP